MMLDELIQELKNRLFQNLTLESHCYYFIKKEQDKIFVSNRSEFTGEIELVVLKSFLGEFQPHEELLKIKLRLDQNSYKGLSIYHFIGVYQQDILNESDFFKQYIYDYFNKRSVKYKFLLNKAFDEFENQLIKSINLEIDTKDIFTKVLRHIYLHENIDKNKVIDFFAKQNDNLDIIDLLLLEDLQNINSIGYDKLQEKLCKDIIWCATEIQSKHKVLNNNEDQYNSNFQSLLKAKDYKTEPQTQRGESFSATQYGELDIAIFSKDNFPLSIFEALVLDSLKADYISTHLKKLSENYDPNGLAVNYLVVYSKGSNFNDFWQKYINFVPTIDFKNPIIDNQFSDITKQFPVFAGIRIGITKHNNNGYTVKIYHICMNMNMA